MKSGGPLGLSIVGGSDHASHPFGVNEPGVFISKVKPALFLLLNGAFSPAMQLTVHDSSHHQVIPHGLASQSGLRVGDRILEVNSIDLRHATHQEAVRALLANKQEIHMLVRRDPSPPGMQVRPLAATGLVKYAEGSNTVTICACFVAGSRNPEAARGETWHQHSWGGQGSCRKPL